MFNTQLGKCINFSNCAYADTSTTIEITNGIPVCPECGALLLIIDRVTTRGIITRIFTCATTGAITRTTTGISNNIIYKAGILFLIAFATPIVIILLLSNGIPEKNTNQTTSLPPPRSVNSVSNSVCTVLPTKIPTKPNWYAVIEIGSKGVKPIAIEFQPVEKGELIPITADPKKTQNVTPKEKARIPDVVNAICEDINSFHVEYGDIPIYIVGSSSMAIASHRAKLEEAITKAIQLPIDFLTAEQEVSYFSKGILIHNPPLPVTRHCQSSIVDIGSGNIRGGYVEYCNPKSEHDPNERLVTFEIPDLGTIAFSKKSAKKSEQENISFNAAATEIRKELEEQLERQVSSRPELTNNKNRIYVVGGAPWALKILLCLDCPQYRERSITDDTDEYTVIKPSDIDEFYNFITQEGYAVCNPDENKYIRLDLDNTGKPLLRDKSEIDKQKDEIRDVCNAFKSNSDLISAAEIMRAVANKMEIDKKGNRKLFFVQKNLYTWSRQYLIEKIERQSSQN